MRHSWLLVAAALCGSNPVAAATSVQVGVASPTFQFDFLYSDYGVAPQRVESGVACVGEPDYLVALQLARVSGVDIAVIIDWRRQGTSWDTITRKCHRDGAIYYTELPADVSGPPYGRAHGYWKKHGKCDLKLTDAEIREFVLVQALSTHCRTSSSEVVRSRAAGKSPRAIATGSRAARPREDAAPQAPSKHGHEVKGNSSKSGKSEKGH
jgi:hypothetical protein